MTKDILQAVIGASGWRKGPITQVVPLVPMHASHPVEMLSMDFLT